MQSSLFPTVQGHFEYMSCIYACVANVLIILIHAEVNDRDYIISTYKRAAREIFF